MKFYTVQRQTLICTLSINREILRLFMSKELINFDTFNNDFGTVLAENEMFQESTKHGKKCIAELKDRLIEHVN